MPVTEATQTLNPVASTGAHITIHSSSDGEDKTQVVSADNVNEPSYRSGLIHKYGPIKTILIEPGNPCLWTEPEQASLFDLFVSFNCPVGYIQKLDGDKELSFLDYILKLRHCMRDTDSLSSTWARAICHCVAIFHKSMDIDRRLVKQIQDTLGKPSVSFEMVLNQIENFRN